jgi:hypothetical protein
MGQEIVFRKDYADLSRIIAARDAVAHELLEQDKRWIQIMKNR